MPLFPNNAGNPSCFDTIDSLFREKIPVLLRWVQFMNHKPEEGQDGMSWREELRNLADNADIKDIDTSDLLCVIYVTGIRDNNLREKLLEAHNPTIVKFDRVMNSFDQAKKQLSEIKPQAQALHAFTQTGRPKQSTKPSRLGEQRTRREASVQRSRGQPSREEQMRRDKLFGKCFRCGKADHMLPDCTCPTHLEERVRQTGML